MPMKDFFGFPWMPIDVSAHGSALDELNEYVHWLMFILFAGWIIYFVYVLFRFREKKNPKANYTGVKSHLGTYLEVAVVLIEIILLTGFSIPLWAKWADDFPPEKDALVIRVVAEQFIWNFHYAGPDGKFGKTDVKLIDEQSNPLGLDKKDPASADDVVTKRLYIPVNKPIITHITSKDVIHSFGVPVLRVKQDAIPGATIPITFTATKTGKYLIACSQLCGIGHARMRGFVIIQTPEEHDKWFKAEVAKVKAGPAEEVW